MPRIKLPRTKKSRTKKLEYSPGDWLTATLTRFTEEELRELRSKPNRELNAKRLENLRKGQPYWKRSQRQQSQQETVRVYEEQSVSAEFDIDHDDGGYSNIVDEDFSHRHTYQDRKNAATDAWERDKFHFKDLYQKSISQGLPRSETTSFGEVTCPSNSCTEMRKTKMNLFFMFAHKKQIVRSCRCRSLIETLMENHFLPATYQSPRSAVHFGALGMMSQMQKIVQTSVTAWAKSLNDRNEKGPRLDTRVLNKTYLAYTRIKLLVEEELQTKASVDTSPAVLPAP